VEEITAGQLSETFYQMHVGKYKELLLVANTCQAFTLGDTIIKRQTSNKGLLPTYQSLDLP
jgi:glycosylphosphatidylinositol transamidase (GPIT) subunit GPI8